MQVDIDHAAGTIWRYLSDHGEITLRELKHGTKLSDQLLFAGIGWLAREEKLNFTTEVAAQCLHGTGTRAAEYRGASASTRENVEWGPRAPQAPSDDGESHS